MAEKKKDPKFGGKRSLKDTSGNQKIGFEDTFLGDLLGFDGKMGTKGKPGLLASLKGARRKKPGAATTKKKAVVKKKVVRPQLRPKPKATKPDLQAFSGSLQSAKPAPRRRAPLQEPESGLNPQAGQGKKSGKGPGLKPSPSGLSKEIKKPKGLGTPGSPNAQLKKRIAKITRKQYSDMNRSDRRLAGLPDSLNELSRLYGFYVSTPKFDALFKSSTNMNKGGMAKKSGYMYGGSVVKKKPATKMMAGGMAKKKPVAKMNKGGMTKKK